MRTFLRWLEENHGRKIPKILWITGMGSTGTSPRQLASMGYDVKSVGTTTNRYAAYLGRFSRYQPISLFSGHVSSVIKSHLDMNVKKHDEEMMGSNFKPDVVVGTSQGGAIAMQIAKQYPNAKFVLGAPAWKIFGANPMNLPPDTIIIHGKNDILVPIDDSIELADKYGYDLEIYDFKHQIPLAVIKQAVDKQLDNLSFTS